MTDEEKPKARAKKKAVKLVKMRKGEGDDCVYADVHPDETENYEKGGWQVDGADS